MQKSIAVVQASKEVDGLEWTLSAADTARDYAHLRNCDPDQDMIFAEINGEVVGYGRCWWDQQLDGTYLYLLFAHLMPAWRNLGSGERWCTGAKNTYDGLSTITWRKRPNIFNDGSPKQRPIGKRWPVMKGINLNDIPSPWNARTWKISPSTPALGLAVKKADLSQWPAIFAAAAEAFRDHWGAEEWSEQDKLGWQEHPTFDPSLWEVAWDGDEVAGGVLPLSIKRIMRNTAVYVVTQKRSSHAAPGAGEVWPGR